MLANVGAEEALLPARPASRQREHWISDRGSRPEILTSAGHCFLS